MPTAAEPFGTIRDRAVYLPAADTLVAADLHLGKAATSGLDVPIPEGDEIVDRLGHLLDEFQPAEVVLAGDVLHSFGFVPRTAKAAYGALMARIQESGAAVTVVEGNHDVQLAELSEHSTTDAHSLRDGTVVCHGHRAPESPAPRYVIGHDHPVIDIQGGRHACYLHGQAVYEGADVLVLPAFNTAVRGTVVNGMDDGDPLSPLLAELSQFQPIIWDGGTDEPLTFPPLEALRSYL